MSTPQIAFTLANNARQITSDTYPSVLPEMMRAEAESVMSVVPRTVDFTVMTPLDLSDAPWQKSLAVFFAHGARQKDNTWAIGAQDQPNSDLFGPVSLDGRGQDDAATAPRTTSNWSGWRTSTTATRRSSGRTSPSPASPSSATTTRNRTTGNADGPAQGSGTRRPAGAEPAARRPPDGLSCPLCVH